MKTLARMAALLAGLGLAVLLAAPAPVWAQWTQAGNDLYTTNLSSEVGIGLIAPQRQLHVQGNNAAFRLDRDVNSTGFMLVRTAAGNFSTIWKTFLFGVRASGVNNGYFVIEDLGTAVGGDGARRLTIDNSGRFAIGTTAALSKLYVNVTGSDGVYISGSDTGDVRLGIKNNSGPTWHWLFDDDSDGHALKLESAAGRNLCFNTDAANERMRITSAGNVGIGTTSPVSKLDIRGGDLTMGNNRDISFAANTTAAYYAGIHMTTTDNLWLANDAGGGIYMGTGEDPGGATTRLTIADDGEVYVYSLATNGAVYSNAFKLTNTAPSSRDYKADIQPADLQAERLLKLNPSSFVWKNNGRKDIGYIAEDVWKVLPELRQDDGKTKGYDVAKLPIYTIELLKDQQRQIQKLTLEVDALKAQLAPKK